MIRKPRRIETRIFDVFHDTIDGKKDLEKINEEIRLLPKASKVGIETTKEIIDNARKDGYVSSRGTNFEFVYEIVKKCDELGHTPIPLDSPQAYKAQVRNSEMNPTDPKLDKFTKHYPEGGRNITKAMDRLLVRENAILLYRSLAMLKNILEKKPVIAILGGTHAEHITLATGIQPYYKGTGMPIEEKVRTWPQDHGETEKTHFFPTYPKLREHIFKKMRQLVRKHYPLKI